MRARLSRRPSGQEVAPALPSRLNFAAVVAPRRRLNYLDFVVLSLYRIAIGYLWNSLTALLLPDLIIQLVGPAHEGLAATFLKSLGTLLPIGCQPIASIAVGLVTTMLATILFVPDRAAPVEGQFRSARELLTKTFGIPFRNRDFRWLMISRLLIFMGFGGLQNFAFFYFDNVFFHNDRKATAIAASTLLGIAIGVAALVTWPASRLSNRTGRKPLIFAAGLLGAVGSLVLVFSHYQWVPAAMLSPPARRLRVPGPAAPR